MVNCTETQENRNYVGDVEEKRSGDRGMKVMRRRVWRWKEE